MNTGKIIINLTKVGILIIVMAFILINPAMAWNKSTNVSVVDNYNSPKMGTLYPKDYPNQTFSVLAPASLSVSALANKDTLFLFATNPSLLNSTQKSIINSWIYNGGKLIIWDAEEPQGIPGGWDYTWLPYPFSTSVPGAMGANGKGLWVMENNQLSSNLTASPFYINTTILNNNTDAVGDANVFTTYSSNWCVNMKAKNTLNVEGPVHTYSFYGNGLIIYSGLDWDSAGSYAGWNWAKSGTWLKKLFKQELEVSGGLQCGIIQPGTPNLVVTKTSNEASYNVSEEITFTITVTNIGTETAYGVNLTDIPPNEISITDPTTFALGDLTPTSSATISINAIAISPKLNVINIANAAGKDILNNIVAGSGNVTFSIDTIPPTVVGKTPTGNNVPVTTQITVTFTETMNESSVQSAFSTTPSTTGSFSWSGDTMTYAPDSSLDSSTTYTVNVGTGAMDLAGNSLQSFYSWQFGTSSAPDTSSPTIIGNTPTGNNVPVTTQITVTFNETMNESSVQSAFSTSPLTTGSFSWSGDTMTYTPGSSLASSTTYTVNVGTDAMDLTGNSLLSPFSWLFTTAPIPDTTPPVINIASPQNILYNTTVIVLDVSANEVISTWHYSLNGGANVTFTPGSMITASQGANTLIVYANDTFGNWNSSKVDFTVDSIAPVITINSPQNTTYSTTSIPLSVSANEAISTWFYSLNGGANVTFTPSTMITASQGDSYLVVYATDAAGNSNSSKVNFSVELRIFIPWTATTQGWTTPYVIANKGSSSANVIIKYYNQADGSNVGTYSLNILPGASKFVFREWTTSTDGSAVLDSDQPITVMVDQFNNGENKFGAYEIDQSGSRDVFMPMTSTINGWTTPFAIVNRGKTNATITATYYNTSGSIAGSHSDEILPGASKFVFREWSVGGEGAAEVTSNQPISLLVDMFKNAENKFEGYTPAAFADNKIFVPWTATTQGWTTPYKIINRGSSLAVVSIEYYNQANGLIVGTDSVNIKPNEVVTLLRESTTAIGTDGSAILNSTQPISVNVEQYHSAGGKFGVYTPAMMASTTIVIPWTATTQGWTTPYVIVNRGGATANVNINYYNQADGLNLGTYSTTILPGASKFVFREWTTSASTTDGSAVVVSDQPVTVMVDQFNNGQNMFGAYTPIG